MHHIMHQYHFLPVMKTLYFVAVFFSWTFSTSYAFVHHHRPAAVSYATRGVRPCSRTCRSSRGGPLFTAKTPAAAPSSVDTRHVRLASSIRRGRRPGLTSSSATTDSNGDVDADVDVSSSISSNAGGGPNLWEKITASLSQNAAKRLAKKYNQDIAPIWQSQLGMSLLTLIRVVVPSVVAGLVAFAAFPALALWLCTLVNDAGVFAVLSQDSSQFVQNFLTVAGLLFSILVGQTYYFMYQQQESVYYALFDEVTEAKSLLEQVALVSQGRSMYQRVLSAMSTYVQTDLKKLQADPAVLLSARPMDDPLETIMYLTSVGVPSTVYETVRSLRQARAHRLGALQRKLPPVHMVLLWILAAIELLSFPLLGAGTQTIGGYKILTIEGCLFGVMTMGIVLTLRVVGELWRPAGGAYNVDNVLKVMVRGLEQELEARMQGRTITSQKGNYPSGPSLTAGLKKNALVPTVAATTTTTSAEDGLTP